jgi:hypothetical protein
MGLTCGGQGPTIRQYYEWLFDMVNTLRTAFATEDL